MSNYVKATNFATKDTLPTGDANKIVKGTEIDNEFNAIAGAISSKADIASPALTGTPTTPTATAGSNTTQIANTAFVTTAVTDERTTAATLTGKTLNLTSNTLTGTLAQFNTALSDADFATLTGAETLTNKTLTSPTINTPTISSPTMTGTPTAPTAGAGNSSTQVATTAFVGTAITNANVTPQTRTITAGTGLTGGGDLSANRTISHADTSSQTSVNNSGNTFIQDITLDDFGHITAIASATLALESGVGTVTNGGTFTVTTGSSGVVLILVQFYTTAAFGNFGNSTGSISIGGSTVASQGTRTMEFDSRTSGSNPVILHKHTGSANSNVTVTFNWSGSGSFQDAKYMFLGL